MRYCISAKLSPPGKRNVDGACCTVRHSGRFISVREWRAGPLAEVALEQTLVDVDTFGPTAVAIGAAVSRARSSGERVHARPRSSSPIRSATRSACARPVSARCRPGARPGSTLPVVAVWPWRTSRTVVDGCGRGRRDEASVAAVVREVGDIGVLRRRRYRAPTDDAAGWTGPAGAIALGDCETVRDPRATVAPHPAAPNRRARRAMVAAGSLLAVVGLAACTSAPSNDRVARDIIETQGSIPDDVRQCMLDLLDTGNYDLDKIGEDNKNYDTPEELAANGTPEYQKMVADLTACRTGATGTTEVTDVDGTVRLDRRQLTGVRRVRRRRRRRAPRRADPAAQAGAGAAAAFFFGGGTPDERGGVGVLGPAPSGHDRQRAQQLHRHLVLLGGAGDDGAVGDHPLDDLLAELGAHDRERPVVVLADAAGGDVGVLGGEVGAVLAALPRPLVALLEVDLVVRAVAHPDLEHALDVHLDHLGLGQAVLGLEQLGEDGVVERLRARAGRC